jgi:hypothetical protein
VYAGVTLFVGSDDDQLERVLSARTLFTNALFSHYDVVQFP